MSQIASSAVTPQTATRIIASTAAAFYVTADDITGPSRARANVRARQAAAWVLRHSPHHFDRCAKTGRAAPVLRSLPQIGGLLGKDHSSIVYHLAQIEARRRTDPGLAALLDALLGGAPLPQPRFLSPAGKTKPAPRQIRARNDFKLQPGDDGPDLADTDAAKRQRGTIALAAALAAYQQERAA